MNMEKVHILDHPLLQHKLSILRDANTGVKDFREVVSEIATLMCYEATRRPWNRWNTTARCPPISPSAT